MKLERRGTRTTRPVRVTGVEEDVRRLTKRIAQLEASRAWWKAWAKRALKIAKEWRWVYKDLG
jgi:hypothetical protein